MKPKIGIVICGINDDRQFVTNSYIRAIHMAGGLPLLLPLVRSDNIIFDYTTLCDGFLFCGGGDITPLLFGEELQTNVGETDITLDLFQLRLMKSVLATGKPILAICRGMQVLNVACGGTIFQDLSMLPDTLNHMQISTGRRDVSHRVSFTKGSNMYRILGAFSYTNSFHHQAVKMPGKGLRITGKTRDGVIESIERPSDRFTVGVQWHPECMLEKSGNMKEVFHAFLSAVRAY